MNSKEKMKIVILTLLFIVVELVLLILSFFAGYTVFLSMLIALASNTFNTIICIIGVFLIQAIGILTLWIIKKAYRLYRLKTGFKIEKD